MRKLLNIFAILIPTFLILAAVMPDDAEKNWPQWRGPYGNGIANGNPPVEWSENKNIKWKIEIPGLGHSTPIVWENQIFVLTAIDGEKVDTPPSQANQNQRGRRGGRRGWMRGNQPDKKIKYTILSINRDDGKINWQKTSREEVPHQGTHNTASWASNSGVTDGKHVWAYYGSRGLYCYDMKGNLQWEKDLGDMQKRLGFGEGSSPALYNDKIVINWDHEGDSFITALDKNTGKEIWRTNRDESTTWSSPYVVEHNGTAQVIVNATGRISSYNLDTGKLIWECGGMTMNAIPMPVSIDGIVYVTTGFRGSALVAIRLDGAKGDITNTDAVIWTYDRDTPYTPSPLAYKNNLYILKVNSEILSCFNAKTGETLFTQKRLDGIKGMYSSPVAANDRIYFAGRNGVTSVLKYGPTFEILSTNTLDDNFDASPVIVGNDLYLRGHKYLYSISE